MDYPGWELERQRAALAALLLGGGVEEEGRRGEAGRSPAEKLDPRAQSSGGGEAAWPDGAGDSLVGPDPWATARPGGRGIGRRGQAVAASLSAWEALLGAESSAEVLERKSWGLEPFGPGGGTSPARGGGDGLPGGGTGAREEAGTGFSGDAEGISLEGGAGRRPQRLRNAARQRRPMKSAEEEDMVFPGVSGEGESAGENAAVTKAPWAARIRRSGGGTEDAGEQDGLPVFQKLKKAGGTVSWGGTRGTGETRAEDSAKALSRAVQRDARRYDGGFTIY